MPLSDDGFVKARGDIIRRGAMVFGKNRKSDFIADSELSILSRKLKQIPKGTYNFIGANDRCRQSI